MRAPPNTLTKGPPIPAERRERSLCEPRAAVSLFAVALATYLPSSEISKLCIQWWNSANKCQFRKSIESKPRNAVHGRNNRQARGPRFFGYRWLVIGKNLLMIPTNRVTMNYTTRIKRTASTINGLR